MKFKVLGFSIVILLLTFLGWYFFIAVKPFPIPQKEIVTAYQYPQLKPKVELTELKPNTHKISFKSFDGSQVEGQISYPDNCAEPCPVLVGISAMGRNYHRWWLDSWKDRPTVTSVNKLGEVALQKGFALVAIDARFHGSRKDPNKTLRSIMNDLHFFGNKLPYENMVLNTTKDYRVLIDWLSSNPKIDSNNIYMAGYSMGGQVSLLTSAVDNRIKGVISIVPPALDDKVARVAPKNLVSLIKAPQPAFNYIRRR